MALHAEALRALDYGLCRDTVRNCFGNILFSSSSVKNSSSASLSAPCAARRRPSHCSWRRLVDVFQGGVQAVAFLSDFLDRSRVLEVYQQAEQRLACAPQLCADLGVQLCLFASDASLKYRAQPGRMADSTAPTVVRLALVSGGQSAGWWWLLPTARFPPP